MLTWQQLWDRMRMLRRDRGVTSLEMVGFVVPAMVATIVIVYTAFVVGLAGIDVTDAAAAAARAASLQPTSAGAGAAALQAAAEDLAAKSVTCAHLEVNTDTSQWRRGGSVTVTVSCTAALHTLTSVEFVPGSLVTSATATAPLETLRATVES